VGALKAGAGERAVGIRDRVLAHLAAVGEIQDPGGMASTALARAVDYPGSSIAFAQLLSGMERSGLIEREIQGKRTYRIAAAGPVRPPGSAVGFDYDELARRLLAQVLRGTVTASAGEGHPVFPAVAAEPGPEAAQGTADDQNLREEVARLEGELAAVRATHRRLTGENARLRDQIQQAEQSLAAIQERTARVPASGLVGPEAALLIERLLSPAGEARGRRGRADAS
jgi:hypothetical protein